MTTKTKYDLITLPNGQRLWYSHEGHRYHACKADGSKGPRLPSVSTLVSPYDAHADPLMRWAAGLTLEGVCQAFHGESVPDTKSVLADRLEEQELTYEHLRQQAADRGNIVHDYLEALAKDADYPDLADASDTETAMVDALRRWWDRTEPQVLQAEQFVLSERFMYAGRFDLRFTRPGSPKPYLMDLKTSNYISPKFMVQLAGYDLAAASSGVGRSVRKFILQVKPDGNWYEHDSYAHDEDFLSAYRIYKRGKELLGFSKRSPWREDA